MQQVFRMAEDICQDQGRGRPGEIRLRVDQHSHLADHTLEALQTRFQMTEKVGCPIVVLAGGVFQNPPLPSLAKHRLRLSGDRVYTNTQFPTNDGGLAIGQAIIPQHIHELGRIESNDD
jgi:hydrogenase maturation factor HypF (carbamoyltransferase family)